MDHQAHEPPSSPAPAPPHVVIFPFQVQGHVNSMLKLAELLIHRCRQSGLCITFINTEHNHRRLLRCSDVASRFSVHPTFRFKTIPDGSILDVLQPGARIGEMLDYLKLAARDVLADVMVPADGRPPATCVIVDGVMSFVIDTGEEMGVPVIAFRTISACSFWAYFCIPRLIEAGELPLQGEEDMDRLITSVPGMEGFLRCRDLPSFCQVTDLSDPLLQHLKVYTSQTTKARGLLLNTFEALEGPILDQIRTHCPNVYSVGPLHAHLRSQLLSAGDQDLTRRSSNSLWEEDRSCLLWLDRQPAGSVVYVSFGSLAVLKGKELTEFWHGLVDSKYRFLWVVRPDSIESLDREVAELREETRERGCIVEWAPQEEVLSHPSVGGFLTHSGWNSTIESITSGVPMVCWPYFADQQTNSRFVDEVWRIGLDMKDRCDRTVVDRMIRDLMSSKRDELVRSAAAMARLATEAVSEGGPSWDNMNRLIEDMRLTSGEKQLSH